MNVWKSGNALGHRWHDQFMKRHGDKIDRVKGFRQDVNRKQWATHKNMEKMHNCTCECMVEKGLAESLDQPVFMNRNGVIVEDPTDTLGLPIHCRLLHPNRILFVDETGCNANMKKDGQVGGKRCIAEKGTSANPPATTNDVHFALLPVANALGEPVCCVVIFQSATNEVEVQ